MQRITIENLSALCTMKAGEMQSTVGGIVAPTKPVKVFKLKCFRFHHRVICIRVRVPMSDLRF